MKKFVISMVVIILLGAVLCGIGCAVYFTGDNRFFSVEVEYTEKNFTAEQGFNEINLNLHEAHNISFKNGDAYSVRYFDSELSDISVSSENNTLIVSEKGFNFKNWLQRLKYKFRTTDIEITVPADTALSIEGKISGSAIIKLPSWTFGTINLKISGAASLVGTQLKTDNITVNASGAADINIGGEFKDIDLHASGASNVTLSGSASSLHSQASGSMELNGNNFNCPLVDLSASGSMDVSLSGVGDTLKAHASGLSEIQAKNFTVNSASFDTSGSLEAEVTVNNTLTVHASGYAKIYYYGDPQITTSGSGSPKTIKRG